MALTAAEQAELSQLEKELGSLAPANGASGGLTPEEQKELQKLEGEVGHLAPQASAGDGGLLGLIREGENKILDATSRSKNPALTILNLARNTEPGRRAVGYLGGLARTGVATATGQAGLEDWKKAAVGEAPSSAEYLERAGVSPGPTFEVPLAKLLVGHEGKVSLRDIEGNLLDFATDPVARGIGKQATKSAAKAVDRAVEKTAGSFRKNAEKLAVNATGATGKQASEFAPGAGRELLDRKIVRFGDNQVKIAERASKAVDQANQQIDDALSKLDSAGVKVDVNALKERLRSKISTMKSDPSQADIAKMLETEIGNIDEAIKASGSSQVQISQAELTKRGYNRKAGNWADPEKGQAGKEMYQTYRQGVEDAAQAADPATAKLFEEGKKAYGILAPIRESAERRAAQVQQHPLGGFLDVTSGVAGASAGGPIGAITAPIARRVVAPRLASSVAVTADSVADILSKVPKFAELQAKRPEVFQAIVSKIATEHTGVPLTSVAESKPTKGPTKWANDGFDKLIAHAKDDKTKAMLEKARADLMKSPKMREMLMRASDLKPGSKAMDKILAQIEGAE